MMMAVAYPCQQEETTLARLAWGGIDGQQHGSGSRVAVVLLAQVRWRWLCTCACRSGETAVVVARWRRESSDDRKIR
jgi:hypothetical protein